MLRPRKRSQIKNLTRGSRTLISLGSLTSFVPPRRRGRPRSGEGFLSGSQDRGCLGHDAAPPAAKQHRHRLGTESKECLDSLGVVLGDSFLETVLLRTQTFGTLLKSVLTFLACLLYFDPNRAASLLAFWLLAPLFTAPEWFLSILGAIWSYFSPAATF